MLTRDLFAIANLLVSVELSSALLRIAVRKLKKKDTLKSVGKWECEVGQDWPAPSNVQLEGISESADNVNLCSLFLHCALASYGAVYCNRSCLWVCDSGRACGVRTLLQPARAQCLRLSEHFFHTYSASGWASEQQPSLVFVCSSTRQTVADPV